MGKSCYLLSTQDWNIFTANLDDICNMWIVFLMPCSVSEMSKQTCHQLRTL